MLDHVSLGVKDLERRRFYDAALRSLGLVRAVASRAAARTMVARRDNRGWSSRLRSRGRGASPSQGTH